MFDKIKKFVRDRWGVFLVAWLGVSVWARVAVAAVGLSAVIAGGLYNATGATAGFITAARVTKLDALPDNATLASTYATQTQLNDKSMWCGSWGASGAPGTTSTRWLQNSTNGTIGTASANGWVTIPFAGTVTEIIASHPIALSTDSVTYTLEVQNSPSALNVVVPAGSTTVVTQTGSISFSKGDLFGIRAVQSGSTAGTTVAPRVSIRCKSSS